MSYYDGGWAPYVPVAERRRLAEMHAAKAAAKVSRGGTALSPVSASSGPITKTFWGRAWCSNLERYSDYENRLPRGRTYLRNGSVIDLQIGAGTIMAKVMGSTLYQVQIEIATVPKAQWRSLGADCAGSIDSLVELLQGRLSKAVMERICQPRTGLFPAPREITLHCSCPDSARMCKHVAATLYGVGVRLDAQPQALFQLRNVDAQDLVAQAGAALPAAGTGPVDSKRLDEALLGDVFGIEMDEAPPLPPPARYAPQKAAPPTPAAVPKKANAAPKKRVIEAKKRISITKQQAIPAKLAKTTQPVKPVKPVKAMTAMKAITPDWVFKLPATKRPSPPKVKTQSGKPPSSKPKPAARKPTARPAAPSAASKPPKMPRSGGRA